MQALVSIVTPCYNGENYLDRFFRSVLAQTYPSLELVFINDGSTDHTEQLAESFRPQLEERGIRFIYEYQENAGQAAALNRGLKLFTGKYMNWMDSDDEILPEFIEKKVDFLENHPEYAYCYGKAIVADEEAPDRIVREIGERDAAGKTSFFEDILFVRNVFFSGYLVRTEALEQVVHGREIYAGPGGQNAQLLLPLAWYYGEPGYAGESVYKYYVRSGSHSHSQNTSEKRIQQLEHYEKILLSTVERIPDRKAETYIETIKQHYARLRFGNAVDTRDPRLIRKYYQDLRELNVQTPHDLALLVKYTIKALGK